MVKQIERSVIARSCRLYKIYRQTSQRISSNHALLGHVGFGLRARL
jgi:hypothetical protein